MNSARSSLLAFATAGGVLAVTAAIRPPGEIAAAPPSITQDSDGDMLPDSLEWALMLNPLSTDSDGDGVDDFLDAVQHDPPLSPHNGAKPLDHEMRAMAGLVDIGGQKWVVLHLLFRLVTPNAWVSNLQTFLDMPSMGIQLPLQQVVGCGVYSVDVRTDPVQGTYVLVSSRVCTENSLRPFLPCAMGATATIGQRNFHSGTLLVDVAGTTAALVQATDQEVVFQPLDPNQEPGQSFWAQNRVCEMQLVPLGQGGTSSLCQVVDAGCTGQATLRCAPDCGSWNGKIFVLPYGLGFLTGN